MLIRKRLIMFTRIPEPGKTKTRLHPVLTPSEAARLHRKLTEKTVKVAKRLCKNDVILEVHVTGGTIQSAKEWLGDDLCIKKQHGGNLGQKMSGAFSHAFKSGVGSVVLIGTDCPDLSGEILNEAFESLEENDVVIGPAVDGGYYLIGLRKYFPGIFENIPWGAGDVFKKTMNRIKSSDLKYHTLTELRDIDRPEDLDFVSV